MLRSHLQGTPELDENYRDAELQLDIDLINYSESPGNGYSIEVDLMDDAGQAIPTIRKSADPLGAKPVYHEAV